MSFQRSKLRPVILSLKNIIAFSVFTLALALGLWGLLSRKKPIKDGVYKNTYPAGTEEVTYQHGKKNGPYKVYWPNGQLHIELNYQNNLPEGSVKHYYDNGQLASEGNALAGLNHGVFKRYSLQGTLAQEDHYQNGVLLDQNQHPFTGTRKEIFEYEGWQENNYKDGRQDGVSKTFAPTGELMFERQFKAGKVVAFRAVSSKMKGPREWAPIPTEWTDRSHK